MNILQINSIDCRGGAAKTALRIKIELESRDNQVNMLVGHKVGDSRNIQEITYPERAKNLNKNLHLRGVRLPTMQYIKQSEYFYCADVVNLHNLHLEPYGYFNIRDLPRLSLLKPTIWTLHDPWLIYEFKKTPQYSPFFSKVPVWYNKIKHSSVAKSEVTIVSPSRWLAGLTQDVFPDKKVQVISNGVDTDIFKPYKKEMAKKKLNLPTNKKLILFVANEGENNIQKGVDYIENVKQKLRNEVNFMSLGSTIKGTYISSEKDLAYYYSAADVFLLPSLAENLPLTILESMACGTPAVAFNTGGVNEIITHKKNGYLANYKDSTDLIDGINYLRDNEQLGVSAIHTVLSKFTLNLMIDNYFKLYSSII